jgi:hypothetical protein
LQARRLPENVTTHDYTGLRKPKEQKCHNWAVLVKELLREMILAKQPILYVFRFSWLELQ